MPIKNPPHPGLGLKFDLEALGLSIAQAAKSLGVTRAQVHRVVKGESAISPEMALRLETVIGSTADQWLRLQAAYDVAQIRERAKEITKGLRRVRAPAESVAKRAA
jgi:addiction module HigA family antidote